MFRVKFIPKKKKMPLLSFSELIPLIFFANVVTITG